MGITDAVLGIIFGPPPARGISRVIAVVKKSPYTNVSKHSPVHESGGSFDSIRGPMRAQRSPLAGGLLGKLAGGGILAEGVRFSPGLPNLNTTRGTKW